MNKQKVFTEVKGYVGMLLGCVLYALSLRFFLRPNGIVAGGLTGLATLINLIDERIPMGMITIALNIPVFLIGLKYTGWKFILRCLLTVAVLGVVTDALEFLPPLAKGDPLLASLYGGVLQGIAVGLFIRCEFSSGGTELLGRVVSKWVKVVNIPVCVGIFDAIIVAAGAFKQGPENILYALIVVFVCTKVSELVLMGLEKSKLCIIITSKGREVAQALIEKSPHGITMMDGEGMYTHQEKNVLLTCVRNRQLTRLRQSVREVDAAAFVIINDSVEVRGKGFTAWDKDV